MSDELGNETKFTQVVTPIGCLVTQVDVDDVEAVLKQQPLSLQLQAAKPAFKSVSFTETMEKIVKALGYDAQKVKLCGAMEPSLVSESSSIQIDPKANMIIVSSKMDTVAETVNIGKLKVTFGAFALQVPIIVTFFECTITELTFESAATKVNYKVGTATSQVFLPSIKQTPDCGAIFDKFSAASFVSDLDVMKAK